MNAIQYAVAVWCQHRHHHHFMHKIFNTIFFFALFCWWISFWREKFTSSFFFIINSVRILWGKKSKTTNETWTGAAKPERQYQGNVRWFWWAQAKIENITENIGAVRCKSCKMQSWAALGKSPFMIIRLFVYWHFLSSCGAIHARFFVMQMQRWLDGYWFCRCEWIVNSDLENENEARIWM